ADLLAGFAPFLEFAQEIGALGPEEADDRRRRCRAALLDVADEQQAQQEDADPCGHFPALLRSVLLSGRAHLTEPNGGCPVALAEVCGWRCMGDPSDPYASWQAQSRRIGWIDIDGDDLCLDPNAAYAECQELSNRQGESLTVSMHTLHRRLKERGL